MENKKEKMITVVIKEPYKEPYVKEIEQKLESYQEIVGGLIEVVGLPHAPGVDIILNEEGKLENLDGNFWLPEYQDCACGTCIMAACRGGEFTSLNEKQIKKAKDYTSYYSIPQGYDLWYDYELLKPMMDKKYKSAQKEAVM